MTSRTLVSAFAGLAALSVAGAALAQTPYGAPTYGAQAYGGAQTRDSSDVFSSLLGALFGVTPGTDAQSVEDDWGRGGQPLTNRRADLSARIDAGVRDGTLTRYEADQLRSEYDALARIEASYSADGRITTAERDDLRSRYRSFSQRLRAQRGDSDGGWQPLAQRSAQFETQVNASLQQRDITRAEALRIRQDYQALVQLEAGYRRNGLDAREIADLNTRYDDLNRRLGVEDQYGGGAGRWTALDARVTTAERGGRINRDEAAMVRAQLADLTRLDIAYRADGLTLDERSYLDRRLGELTARLQLVAR